MPGSSCMLIFLGINFPSPTNLPKIWLSGVHCPHHQLTAIFYSARVSHMKPAENSIDSQVKANLSGRTKLPCSKESVRKRCQKFGKLRILWAD